MLPAISAKLKTDRRSDRGTIQRSAAIAGQIAVHGRRENVPLALQPLDGNTWGFRADVGRRGGTHGHRSKQLIVPGDDGGRRNRRTSSRRIIWIARL